MTKPFIKWVGGKGRLLKDLIPLLPVKFNNYFEPFVGGGAMFFKISESFQEKRKFQLSDMNEQLITTYCVIRDNYEDLIPQLKLLEGKNNIEDFQKIRGLEVSQLSDIDIAARFCYLNKTAFNGMWRVNSKGGYNVPFGKYESPNICNEDVLYEAFQALQGVDIKYAGYADTLLKVKKGDFVYIDPPYDPISLTSSFTAYTKDGFGRDRQLELKVFCDELTKKGVHFMQSNSDSDFMNELYKEYRIEKFNLTRSVGAKSESRKKAVEIVVMNYK